MVNIFVFISYVIYYTYISAQHWCVGCIKEITMIFNLFYALWFSKKVKYISKFKTQYNYTQLNMNRIIIWMVNKINHKQNNKYVWRVELSSIRCKWYRLLGIIKFISSKCFGWLEALIAFNTFLGYTVVPSLYLIVFIGDKKSPSSKLKHIYDVYFFFYFRKANHLYTSILCMWRKRSILL